MIIISMIITNDYYINVNYLLIANDYYINDNY